jgi:DNA-binding ferritin-like protein
MPQEITREPEMGLTFEKVWAMFQEIAERSKETDRQIQETAERFKETDRQFKETDRKFKETDRKISRLGDRLGELIEHLMAAHIVEKFNRLGYAFGRANPNARFFNPRNELVAEVDILLENGDVALAVEVKSKLTADDIAYHVGRMERLRRYADEHGDRRRRLGAVAGAIMSEGVKPFALKNGFYVIEQSGDTATIAVPEGFVPKEW